MTRSLVWVGVLASLALIGCEVPPLQVTPQPRREVVEAPGELPKVPRAEAAAAEAARGFKVEVAVRDLIYPTSVEVDDKGNLYVAEGGYVYGDHAAPARIWRIGGDGEAKVIAEQLNGPVTDILWHEGRLYVSHKTKISVVGEDGKVVDLVTDLPSLGDHFNNQLAVGPDGKIYFGQGVATNSGVVGVDNFVFGWLGMHPKFHDVPGRDIRVKEKTFVTLDPMVLTDKREPPLVRTAPFNAFGRGAEKERIGGQVKANGTILRMNPDGSQLEVFAWGLRNPFGLTFTKDGRLFATDNGYDERGSRPIGNAPDVVWQVRQDAWYGFPDFAGGEPVTNPKFKPRQGPSPEFIMEDHPPVEKPVARLPHQAGVAKAAAADGRMGLGERLVVALFGDMSPITGQDKEVGREVVLVDPQTGQVERLFGARAEALGPKNLEHVQTAGPKRPVDVVFSRSGDALYVVDMGAITVIPAATPTVQPYPGTGVVWRISRDGGGDVRGPVDVSPLKGRGTAGAERSAPTQKENDR
jgi:glucose/arabinose dehydrogenase